MEQRFSDLIIRLANGISQRRMYFDAHPRVVSTSREVATDITELLRETGSDSLSFGVFGGKFVRNGRYLVGPSIAGRALIDFAERLGCGGFTFRAPVTPEDLTTFFRLGAERGEPYGSLAEAQSAFVASGLTGVTLAAPLVEDNSDTPAVESGVGRDHDAQEESIDVSTADFATLVHIYQAMYDTVACNALAVLRDGSVDFDRARSAGAGLVDLADRNSLDVMQFLRYPDYDSYTIGHSVRVAALSAMVARELGWPPAALAELATAGLLHDVGKGRIPGEILFKPGRLDDDERRVIETHPSVGARILLDNGEASALVLSATWGHHLRHDGGGYPDVPGCRCLGIVPELVHVCDVFEALTAQRPYKKPMSPRRAFEIMLDDETAFHPRLLAALVNTLGLYPPGSEVRLSDRRTAVVVARGTSLARPRLRVTREADGELIPRDDRPYVDLRTRADLDITGIVSVGAAI
jgi:putative nucleotidyltransferase with HDIG domain